MANSRESAKEWLRRTGTRLDTMAPYLALIRYVKANDAWIGGSVTRHNHHYVHERSTSLSLEAADFRSGNEEADTRAERLLNSLEIFMADWMVGINRQIYKNLRAEFESLITDEAVAESLDVNGFFFEEDGTEIERESEEDPGVSVMHLPEHVRDHILDKYRDFNV